VLEMSPAASNAANLDLPIGLNPRPRDGIVVPSPHCMNDPQPEGSHGKLHRTTKILSHASRRRGGVAARGAGAAATESGNRFSQRPLPAEAAGVIAAFRKGLSEIGFVAGQPRWRHDVL
jgi:hypothetical protein